MEIEAPLKTDDIKRLIREQIREQLGQSLQDMEEIRRSPAASIIRMEEEIKSIKQLMVTKEEFRSLEGSIKRLEGRFEGLEGRIEGVEGKFEGLEAKFESLEAKFEGLKGRFKGLEGKMNLITGLIFVMLTLYGALVVKLIFFP